MIKLHIGCGKRDFGPDWVHIDGGDFHHVKYNDVWLDYDIDEGPADLIYSSHLLEYFDRDEAAILLKNWYKAMKPGGTIRIAVPDFDMMVLAVTYHGFKLKDILGPLYGKMPMGDETIYHKTVYDFESLKDLLQAAGFKNVHRYDWRQTDHSQFDDHSQAYLPHLDKDNGILISLNVEATK